MRFAFETAPQHTARGRRARVVAMRAVPAGPPGAVAIVVLLLLGGACGGGTPSAASDRAMAAKGTIRVDDLPAGFAPPPASPQLAAARSQLSSSLAGCLGLGGATGGGAGRASRTAEGPDLVQGQGTTVGSSVIFAPSTSAASKAADRVAAPAFRQCLNDALRVAVQAQAPPNVSLGGVDSTDHPVLKVGDRTSGVRFSVDLKVGAITAGVVFDLLTVRKGRALGVYSFLGVFKPVPDQVEAKAVTRAVGRL